MCNKDAYHTNVNRLKLIPSINSVSEAAASRFSARDGLEHES